MATTPTTSCCVPPTAEATVDCDKDPDAAVVIADAIPVEVTVPLVGTPQEDTKDGVDPQNDDAAMCAISYQQLMDLDERARRELGRSAFQRATMRTINERIIEPSCRQTGKCYARQLNPEGLLIGAFITHAWDEPFGAFVEVRSCLV